MIKQKIPSPPGGQLNCEVGQMPIVDVDPVTNEVFASCNTPPEDSKPDDDQPLAYKNWAISVIKKVRRKKEQPISKQDTRMLISGKYEFYDEQRGTNIVRYFSLAISEETDGGPGGGNKLRLKREAMNYRTASS